MKPNRIVLDPGQPAGALRELALCYELDTDTLEYLRRIVALYARPVFLQVNQAGALFYHQTPLVDKFTFNIQSDELILFASDPLTFVDAALEMAMYQAGFSTMIGVDDGWKVEFAIGAWKPVKCRLKRELGIPVFDEPLWVVGLPPEPEETSPDDPHPFLTLVAQLDIASFTQMVRLAARDDVEVSFPEGSDPQVIQVYLRVKSAIDQVANGLSLEDWREFNHRLLAMVNDLEDEFNPGTLPEPTWWQSAEPLNEQEEWPHPSSEDSADWRDVRPGDHPVDAAPEPGDDYTLAAEDIPDSLAMPPDDDAQDRAAPQRPPLSSEWQSPTWEPLTEEEARRLLESLTRSARSNSKWNPFESYLDELLGDEDEPL